MWSPNGKVWSPNIKNVESKIVHLIMYLHGSLTKFLVKLKIVKVTARTLNAAMTNTTRPSTW